MKDLKRRDYYKDLCLEYIYQHFKDVSPKKMQIHLKRMLVAVISLDLEKDLRNVDLDLDLELELDSYIDAIILSAYLELAFE